MSRSFAVAVLLWACAARSATVGDLRCEYLVDPQGIDAARPRLGWIMHSDRRGAAQTAYQVLVASPPQMLDRGIGDLWDSGKVDSPDSIQVGYQGQPLVSLRTCYWKVCVWDQWGDASRWSKPAQWSMGMLGAGDWRAKWIGRDPAADQGGARAHEGESRRLAARWLRKEFPVAKNIARASVCYSGLGWSELYVNGSRIGDEVLSPALSDYRKRVFYVTRDVSSALRLGTNAIGVVLGNGRFFAPRLTDPKTETYGAPKLLLQLHIDYEDGSSEDVVTDETWRLSADGPIVANNEYDGDEYDARREFAGWDRPGFRDASWRDAELVEAPGGVMSAPMIDPIRVTGVIKPAAVTEPKPGTFVFDLGQNIAGWCLLRVSGPSGRQVRLRFSERLREDGTLYTDNLRSAKATDLYTLKGGGPEAYEPRFTLHGFRYVEVTGYPGTPAAGAIEGHVVGDDLEAAGEFACSNPLLNRIYRNVVWGVRGNYRSIPTDCPQRDERQGWLGDRSAESRGEAYLFRNNALYAKWVQDMADAQRGDGAVPDVCPAYWAFYNDSVTWPSSIAIIPGALLDQDADRGLIERAYPAIARWLGHQIGLVQGNVSTRDTYADWCEPPESPELIHSKDPSRKTAGPIMATTYLYHCLQLGARYAKILGNPDDAKRFEEEAQSLRQGLNDRFFRRDLGQYDNGSATSFILPLAFDMVPEGDRARVAERLVEKIMKDNNGHGSHGLVGGQWVNRVLTRCGHGDVAYAMATQTTYPSLGYMVTRGATTVWELWNGDTAEPSMNSGNHVMLVGDLVTWLYEDIAGIAPDEDAPGFRHILMRPTPVGDLTSVKASYRSLYGTISSEWRRQGATFSLDVTVPANATATVFVPTRSAADVTESGKPAAKADGVRFLRSEGAAAAYEIGSGTYHFRSGPGT
ncbi:MAG TPA: family 78 glycoside hydrolase catalytic domain [Opitutaceae bacterium]|nr:family 78 glycoside hydrolase catalytic domain [Opitutaceae bacterium]